MLTLPENITRGAQAYAYVTYTVTMSEMMKPADEGFPAVLAALGRQGITPVGAPFYNYRRIDMAATLDVEAGIAVDRAGTDDGPLTFGMLPGGRFMTMVWHGHPDKLEQVTGLLVGWQRLSNQPFDVVAKSDGDHFACRLEIYETDPDDEPDMDKWVTRLEFKLKD